MGLLLQDMLHKFITGESEMMTININGPRIIPVAIYRDALAHPPAGFDKFNHIINLCIDGVEYKDKYLGDLATALIYHAAVDKMFEDPVDKLVKMEMNDLSLLPGYLALVECANVFLKDSRLLVLIKSQITYLVGKHAEMIRALVCSHDYECGSLRMRLELAREGGINVPGYLVNYIALPTNDRHKIIRALNHVSVNYRCESHGIMPHGANMYVPTIGNGVGLFRSEITRPGTEVVDVNQDMANDIIYARRDLMLAKNPTKFKVEGFGPECERILREIVYVNVDLCSSDAPEMTIYDVFKFGLGVALEADYE